MHSNLKTVKTLPPSVERSTRINASHNGFSLVIQLHTLTFTSITPITQLHSVALLQWLMFLFVQDTAALRRKNNCPMCKSSTLTKKRLKIQLFIGIYVEKMRTSYFLQLFEQSVVLWVITFLQAVNQLALWKTRERWKCTYDSYTSTGSAEKIEEGK